MKQSSQYCHGLRHAASICLTLVIDDWHMNLGQEVLKVFKVKSTSGISCHTVKFFQQWLILKEKVQDSKNMNYDYPHFGFYCKCHFLEMWFYTLQSKTMDENCSESRVLIKFKYKNAKNIQWKCFQISQWYSRDHIWLSSLYAKLNPNSPSPFTSIGCSGHVPARAGCNPHGHED